ncbi:hypothetical protein JYU14_00710 [Simkania negevensis]|uniref:Uncharacterized protein n=1 Tax=Simkania negevensis TaxID=83561 RepID=A0ABS3AQM2_9BACT|nr:hypothetical protein [Simkania negevensis]
MASPPVAHSRNFVAAFAVPPTSATSSGQAPPAAHSTSARSRESRTSLPLVQLYRDRLKEMSEYCALSSSDGTRSGYKSSLSALLTSFSDAFVYGPFAERLRGGFFFLDVQAIPDLQGVVLFRDPEEQKVAFLLEMLCKKFPLLDKSKKNVASALDAFCHTLKKDYPLEFTQTAVLAICCHIVSSLEVPPSDIAAALSSVKSLLTIEEREQPSALNQDRYCCTRDIPRGYSSPYVRFRWKLGEGMITIDVRRGLEEADFLSDSHSLFAIEFSREKTPSPVVLNLGSLSLQTYQSLEKNSEFALPGIDYFKMLSVDEKQQNLIVVTKWISSLEGEREWTPDNPSKMTSHIFFEIALSYRYALLKEKGLLLEDFIRRSFLPLLPPEKRRQFFYLLFRLWSWQTNGAGLTSHQYQQLAQTIPADLTLNPSEDPRLTKQDAFIRGFFEQLRNRDLEQIIFCEAIGVQETSDLHSLLLEVFFGEEIRDPGSWAAEDDDDTPPPPLQKGVLQVKHSEYMQRDVEISQAVQFRSFLQDSSVNKVSILFFWKFIRNNPEASLEVFFDSLALFNFHFSDTGQKPPRDNFVQKLFVDYFAEEKDTLAPEEKKKVLKVLQHLLKRNLRSPSYREAFLKIMSLFPDKTILCSFMEETASLLFEEKITGKKTFVDALDWNAICDLISRWKELFIVAKSGKSKDETIISRAISHLFALSQEGAAQSGAASQQKWTFDPIRNSIAFWTELLTHSDKEYKKLAEAKLEAIEEEAFSGELLEKRVRFLWDKEKRKALSFLFVHKKSLSQIAPPDLLDFLMSRHKEGRLQPNDYALFDSERLIRQACTKPSKDFFVVLDLILNISVHAGVNAQEVAAHYFSARNRQELSSKDNSYDAFLKAALIHYGAKNPPDLVVRALEERFNKAKEKLNRYVVDTPSNKSLEQEIDSLKPFVDLLEKIKEDQDKRPSWISPLIALWNGSLVFKSALRSSLPKQLKAIDKQLASLDTETTVGAKAAALLVICCYKNKIAIAGLKNKKSIDLAAKYAAKHQVAFKNLEVVLLFLARAEIQDDEDALLEASETIVDKITGDFFQQNPDLVRAFSILIEKISGSLLNSFSTRKKKAFFYWLDNVVVTHVNSFDPHFIFSTLFSYFSIYRKYRQNVSQSETDDDRSSTQQKRDNNDFSTQKIRHFLHTFDQWEKFADFLYKQMDEQKEWTGEKIGAIYDLLALFNSSLLHPPSRSESLASSKKNDLFITAFCLLLKLAQQSNLSESQREGRELFQLQQLLLEEIFKAIDVKELPLELFEARYFLINLDRFLLFAESNESVLNKKLSDMILLLFRRNLFVIFVNSFDTQANSPQPEFDFIMPPLLKLITSCFPKIRSTAVAGAEDDPHTAVAGAEDDPRFILWNIMNVVFNLLYKKDPNCKRANFPFLLPEINLFIGEVELSLSEFAAFPLSTMPQAGDLKKDYEIVVYWLSSINFRFMLALLNKERGASLAVILGGYRRWADFSRRVVDRCSEEGSKETQKTSILIMNHWQSMSCDIFFEKAGRRSLLSEDEKTELCVDLCSRFLNQKDFSGFFVLHTLLLTCCENNKLSKLPRFLEKILDKQLQETSPERLDNLFAKYIQFLFGIRYEKPDLDSNRYFNESIVIVLKKFMAKQIELNFSLLNAVPTINSFSKLSPTFVFDLESALENEKRSAFSSVPSQTSEEELKQQRNLFFPSVFFQVFQDGTWQRALLPTTPRQISLKEKKNYETVTNFYELISELAPVALFQLLLEKHKKSPSTFFSNPDSVNENRFSTLHMLLKNIEMNYLLHNGGKKFRLKSEINWRDHPLPLLYRHVNLELKSTLSGLEHCQHSVEGFHKKLLACHASILFPILTVINALSKMNSALSTLNEEEKKHVRFSFEQAKEALVSVNTLYVEALKALPSQETQQLFEEYRQRAEEGMTTIQAAIDGGKNEG